MKKKISTSTVVAVGAGVAAIATASYYLFGPEGEHHRHNVKGWMIKMKGEIIDKVEDVKDLTEPVYHEIIDSVMASYLNHSKVAKTDLEAFANRLKGQWKDIVALAMPKTKKSSSKKSSKK